MKLGPHAAQDLWITLLCAALVLGSVLFGGCTSGDEGAAGSQTCPDIAIAPPEVLEAPVFGGDFIVLCGDGTIIECPEASCAFGGTAGNPNSGNTSDSNNPTTTTTNKTPPAATP
jgi:hypothetical protein